MLRTFRSPLAIALALGLALLAGCGSGEESDTSAEGLPEEIVIGAAIAKSGYLVPYDANIAAVEQLVKETNARGGIDGSKLRIVSVDNHSEPQRQPVAVQEVIEDGADVLLFSCEVPIAAAGAPIAEEHNQLNFTLCASEPGYGPPYTGRLSFSPNRSLISEAAARATFLWERGVRRPFELRDTSILLGEIDQFGFQETWEHLGGKLAGQADFKNEDLSIASQIAEIKRSGADAINLSSYPPGGASAIKQIRAAGIDLPITTVSAFDGTFWLKGVPDTRNVYATLNGSAYDPTDAQTAELFERMKRAGVSTDVSGNLLASYAAGQLILDAIRETGTTDGAKLATFLEAKPRPTVMGPLSYTPDNHLPSGPWYIYEYPDRKPKLLERVKPAYVPEYEQ
ncbi:MAG TPA: ABC transporter substrate-binding protein [Solirubrobacterales bacterium]|nr:ABC transporter substrate-binding protein [Solirubrobacterales bacterium]